MFYIFLPKMRELAHLPDILRATPQTPTTTNPNYHFGWHLGTFSYNHETGKTNLVKYLIRSEKPFSMAKDDAFTDYIRTNHNPDYEPVNKNTIRSEMFKVFEEQK